MSDNDDKLIYEKKLEQAEENLVMLERKKVQVSSCIFERNRVNDSIKAKIIEIKGWKTKIAALIVFILLIQGCSVKEISMPFQMWSIHSAGRDMTENHKPMGGCLKLENDLEACYVDFTNSFGDPGNFQYIDIRLKDFWYMDNSYLNFGVNGGFRHGVINGYKWQDNPIPVSMPYFGLCYRGKMGFSICAENTTIPDIGGSSHYLTLTLVKLRIEI